MVLHHYFLGYGLVDVPHGHYQGARTFLGFPYQSGDINKIPHIAFDDMGFGCDKLGKAMTHVVKIKHD